MAKKYDAAGKQLVDSYPVNWGTYLASRVGLSAAQVEVVDSDVSSMYDEAVINDLFHGVTAMKESTTYQAILREGKEIGAVGEANKVLLRLGRRRFGPPTAEVEAAIQAIDDVDRLERMCEAVITAANWNEVLATS